MAEALDTAFRSDPKKSRTATIAKNPDSIVDFVPIENNQQDFDIGEIINEVSKEDIIRTLEQLEKENAEKENAEKQRAEKENRPQKQPNTDQEESEVKAPKAATENVPKNAEPELALSASQSVMNNISNQSLPILPKMLFQNSSVTINYNFNINK